MITFLSVHDYANFSHDMANSLRTVRSDVQDFSRNSHVFKYPSHSTKIFEPEMIKQIERSDMVVIMHSHGQLLDLCLRAKNRPEIVVFHTGSRYRQEPDFYNKTFNPHVSKSILALAEFWDLGAKNQEYIVGGINTDFLKHKKKKLSDPVAIYHLPSKAATKGTETVVRIASSLEGDYKFSYKTTLCPYLQNLEMMDKCDIYLELFAPKQGDKPYGSWGITALEAAALGKVVFTQHAKSEVYLDTYGQLPALECHDTEISFKSTLQRYVDSPELIKIKQEAARKWVVQNHSFAATGKRLAKLLNL